MRMSMLSPSRLTRAYGTGEADPVEVAARCISRARDVGHGVFTTVTEERALAEATASSERYRQGAPLGPLDGVPVAWKDLFDIAGTVTTAGSRAFSDHKPAGADAPAVARFAAAGAVCIGKTGLSELAYSGLGINSYYGTPQHPSAPSPDRIVGGSSSGAAVAVAVEATSIAIGTDTSGSVRIPAALTGVTGYKPTAERLDRRALMAVSPTLDSVGVLSADMDGIVTAEAYLRAHDVQNEPLRDVARPVLLIPRCELVTDLDEATALAFEKTIGMLGDNGWVIERTVIPALTTGQTAMDRHGTIVAAEAAWVHRELLASARVARLDPRTRQRLEMGTRSTAVDYLQLMSLRTALIAQLRSEIGDAAVIFPTVRLQAPCATALEQDAELYASTNLRVLRSTMLGSYLNMPGIAIPTGVDGDGLPTSLLVSLGAGDDLRLLAIAQQIEASLDTEA
jgi:aspartyl-tRNA(Asn)/glutamyl-tRNA(Gln) amidotransferase subunit A